MNQKREFCSIQLTKDEVRVIQNAINIKFASHFALDKQHELLKGLKEKLDNVLRG